MYELRYRLKAITTCGVESCTAPGCKGVEKVLQFRTRDKHTESPTTTPAPLGWTEWEDVPTETNTDTKKPY